jgi:hypothetical protein
MPVALIWGTLLSRGCHLSTSDIVQRYWTPISTSFKS